MTVDLLILTQQRLRVVPVTLSQAKAFVGQEHRHHGPPVGHRVSIGVADETGVLRGVAVAGRPVAKGLPQYTWLEVTRVATDGCPNACSCLYGAMARVGVALGYERHNIITYTLSSESGISLTAAGWARDHVVEGRSWDRSCRRRTDKAPTEDKDRWRAAPVPG